uniref:Cubilin n=1 Tax=Macrostomum lignano TaxID=282301 RepID=A0A1I8I2Q7_9PLAT
FSAVSSGLQGIRQSLEANVSNALQRLRALQSSIRSHRTEFQRLGLARMPHRVSSLTNQLTTLSRDVRTARNQVIASNPCDSNPCRNGGSCLTHYSATGGQQQFTAGFRCLCNEAWTVSDGWTDRQTDRQ